MKLLKALSALVSIVLVSGMLTMALAQKRGGPKPSGPQPTKNPRPFPAPPPKPNR